MHYAADHLYRCGRAKRSGRRIAACLLCISVLSACSSTSSRHNEQRPGNRGRVYVIPGPGGGFLAVPGAAGSGGRPNISVPPVPPEASGQAVNLPLNTYADVAGLQQTVLAEAESLLTQKCMAARGFVYTSATTPAQEQALLQNLEYRFGVSSLSDASTFGYHPSGSSIGPQRGLFLGGFSSFNAVKKNPALAVALIGYAPGVRISPVRQQGCLIVARNEIYRPGSAQLGDPVPLIAEEAMQWTQTDPRIRAVDAAWSRCMAQRAYHYTSPLQPAEHNWPASPTAAETATAVADVTCKQQVNLPNTWLTVEAAYQTALISQNITALASLQASFRSALNRAEALLTTPVGQVPGVVNQP